jgi:high-affinity Fe2+/Pb2+ permease
LTVTEQTMKRHPVRGGLFGLMLGISAAYFLYFQFAVFGFDTVGAVTTRFVVIILVGVAVGVIWAYVAPPKAAKEPAPAAAPSAPEANDEA